MKHSWSMTRSNTDCKLDLPVDRQLDSPRQSRARKEGHGASTHRLALVNGKPDIQDQLSAGIEPQLAARCHQPAGTASSTANVR